MSEPTKVEEEGDKKETEEVQNITSKEPENIAAETAPENELDRKEADDSDVVVENETEDGYRSDRSDSDEGSTDAVTERKREKGSSGYEESDEEEEGISELSEGRRERREEEEDEYDKEATEEASSGEDISEDVREEGSEGYEEDTEGEDESRNENEAEEDQVEDGSEDVENASYVPRRTGFWGHDDRLNKVPLEESKYPRRGKDRQLWDKTSHRWEHDMFKEEMQGPKEPWEVEESLKAIEQRQQGRNRRHLGDFIGNRRRSGNRGGSHGSSRGSSRGEERQRRRPYREEREDEQNDSSDLVEERDRPRREAPPRERGRSQHLRGRPRGRASFKGEGRPDRMSDGFRGRENVEARQDEAKNVEKEEGNEPRTVERSDKRRSTDDSAPSAKPQRGGDEEAGQSKEPSRQKKTPPRRKPTGSIDKETDGLDYKGRGKGIISQKVSTSKKTATEFNVVEESTERAEEEIDEKQEVDAVESKRAQGAAKPKRYSSQRQRANASEDTQYQSQVEPTIQEGEYYGQMTPQGFQDMLYQQNSMALLQYQMQRMQMQLQNMQAQGYDAAHGAPTQQQQQQGNLMMKPIMQQYLMQMQAFQQMQQQQQQQQGQQQQQQMQQQQQQQQIQQQQEQQQRLQEMNMNQSISTEKQQASSDRGMVVPGNTYTTLPNNMGQFGVVPHPPPGIYTQTGPRYDVPYDQMMQARAPPQQQQPGLFIPPMQQIPAQMMQMQDPQRKMRSAAIPIKPPPEQQES